MIKLKKPRLDKRLALYSQTAHAALRSAPGPIDSRLIGFTATAGAALLFGTSAEAAIFKITNTNLLVDGSLQTPWVTFSARPAGFTAQAGQLAFGVTGGTQFVHTTTLNLGKRFGFASFFKLGGHPISFAGNGTVASNITNKNTPLADLAFSPSAKLLFARTNSTHSGSLTNFHQKGMFEDSVTGYAAFRFTQGTQKYYGWLRLKLTTHDGNIPDGLMLLDKDGDNIYGAYGLGSDQLTIGSTVPEPASSQLVGLGLLALGVGGIVELRRRRAAAASPTKGA